jgi:hypothetical protein
LEKIEGIEKSKKSPFSRERFFAPELYSLLKGIFNFDLRPGRFGHILKIGLEDVFVKAQHQAAALGAQGRVIIKSGHPLVPAPAIHTLVFIDRHN